MNRLICSYQAMILIAASAALQAVSAALAAAFYATLGPDSTPDLLQASDWVSFGASITALLAIGSNTWDNVLRKDRAGAGESASALIATLMYFVGSLIAASAFPPSRAAYALAATGIGLWAFLALSRAARASLAQRELAANTDHPHTAAFWLAAAAGLLLLAVGYGLTDYYQGTTTIIVTTGVLTSGGIAVLCGAVAAAQANNLLGSKAIPTTLVGLVALAGAILAFAVVAAFEFGAGGTLTGIRIGQSITSALQAAAWLVLARAAWAQAQTAQVRLGGC